MIVISDLTFRAHIEVKKNHGTIRVTPIKGVKKIASKNEPEVSQAP